MFEDKVILVTGGTGSFGRAVSRAILDTGVQKLIIFSRNEEKQVEMERTFADPRIRYFIGDIRDRSRLWRALNGVHYVIHAAALKHVHKSEYNPCEAIATNVMGAKNLINASIDRGVEKVLAISTDKAVCPVSLYGAAKLCSDKLFIHANVYSPDRTLFSVIRFGNFTNSSESVFIHWARCRGKGHPIEITDPNMTRFFIRLPEATKLAIMALLVMRGGEVYSPKMNAVRIMDLVTALHDGYPTVITGIRQGEKVHEELIGTYDAVNTTNRALWYITYQSDVTRRAGTPVPPGFIYSSSTAERRDTEWIWENVL